MTIKAIKCKKCNTIIFSRSRHDFHWCPCGACAIDGGQEDYISITGAKENWEFTKVEIPQTLEELENDYQHGYNKYGEIKNENLKD